MDGNDTRENDADTQDETEDPNQETQDQAAKEAATGPATEDAARGPDQGEASGDAAHDGSEEGGAGEEDDVADGDLGVTEEAKPDPSAVMTNEEMLVDQLRKLSSGEISREAARTWLAEQYPD